MGDRDWLYEDEVLGWSPPIFGYQYPLGKTFIGNLYAVGLPKNCNFYIERVAGREIFCYLRVNNLRIAILDKRRAAQQISEFEKRILSEATTWMQTIQDL